MTYKPDHHPETGKFRGVIRHDGAQIPNDPGNADWRLFLEWERLGNYAISRADKPVNVPPPTPAADPLATLKTLTDKEKQAVLDIAIAGYIDSHPGVIEQVRKV